MIRITRTTAITTISNGNYYIYLRSIWQESDDGDFEHESDYIPRITTTLRIIIPIQIRCHG